MADTVFKSAGSVTTIIGAMNQFQAFADLDFVEDLRTTLNTKYNILAERRPTTVPMLRYFGIGVRGYQNTDGNQGALPFSPKATDMDLYTPIPFRCVPATNDLTQSERQKYRMRVRATYNGVEYICYYLKTITWDPSHIELVQKDTDDVETPYALDPSNLNPEPPTFETGGSIDTNLNRVIVRATGVCEVTGAEVMEAVNVIYGANLMYSRISEFGFYTGCEIGVDADEQPVDGSGVNTEAVYVQLCKKRCTLGTDLSDPGSYMRPYISFESSCCLEI